MSFLFATPALGFADLPFIEGYKTNDNIRSTGAGPLCP
jgi:hypothetical protein